MRLARRARTRSGKALSIPRDRMGNPPRCWRATEAAVAASQLTAASLWVRQAGSK